MRLVHVHLLLLGLPALIGCLPSEQHPTQADLHATDTPARVPAIVNAAEDDEKATLRELVHALTDKDPAVRLFAIQSLEQRTGQTLDYRYYESAEKRQAATDRWHAWIEEDSSTKLATPGNEDTTD